MKPVYPSPMWLTITTITIYHNLYLLYHWSKIRSPHVIISCNIRAISPATGCVINVSLIRINVSLTDTLLCRL